MQEKIRMLKARCKETGRYYGLELRQVGSEWKVVNMVWLSDEESRIINSEVKQPIFYSNDNLLACSRCKTRMIGGCSCLRRKQNCSRMVDYRLDCIYCDKLEIDYSRTVARGPYTKWVGRSNIPDAVKDKYGNPQGSQYDLALDGSFKGYTIILLNLCSNECDFNAPRKALEKKGFKIIEYTKIISSEELRGALNTPRSQFWLISGRTRSINYNHYEVVRDYFDKGNGIYLWSDNSPYFADSNPIIEKLFGSSMSGDYRADQVLGIQKRNKEPGIVPNHPITTGIVNFYEGITISNVKITKELEPLMYSSDGKVVAAYYDYYCKRALVDGGFTRLYFKWDSAGTDRYVVNAAAWLANIEYFGYDQD